MSERIAKDARKEQNASKAIPKGQRPPPKARAEQGVGGPVVGRRKASIQSAWPLCRHAQERGRSAHGANPRINQRVSGSSRKARLHVRRLRGGGFPALVPAEMEGVNSNDY